MSLLNRLILSTSAFSLVCTTSLYAVVHINQVGYYPNETKTAIIVGATAESFSLVSSDNGSIVYTGKCSDGGLWDASEETTKIADFTEFTQLGDYRIRVAGHDDSYSFKISKNVHLDLAKVSIKAFYYNRASTALEGTYAGKYVRPLGHEDKQVTVHASAASDNRPAGTKISSPGGWYDAGDFGKYIVNSGISTYTMLLSYSAFSSFYDTLGINIPEKSNGVPDLIDEILWNLRWMLTMQDPADGGVYHKLTSKGFCGDIMPHEDSDERFVIKKSTAATLDFAAVTANASRVLRSFESKFPGLADSCIQASQKAWQWARKNPTEKFTNPEGISTGQYGDNIVSDEFFWAGIELYVATQQDSFYTIANSIYGNKKFDVPSWSNVATLGLFTLYFSKDRVGAVVDMNDIVAKISALAGTYATRYESHPYRNSMEKKDFIWGSNSVAANQGIVLLTGYLATGNLVYKDAAIGTLDYLLGKNPTAYCFVTGMGDKQVMNIHHRASTADGVTEPIPGFLAGGPNSGQNEFPDCEGWGGCPTYPFPIGTKVAMSFVDQAESYASNEVAINWNAPLVFLSGAMEYLQNVAITNKEKPTKMTRKEVVSSVFNRGSHSLTLELPANYSGTASVIDFNGKILKKVTFHDGGMVTIGSNHLVHVVLILIDAKNGFGKKVQHVLKVALVN